MIVLGIETSCDETAAAIVVDGRLIRSSIVSSQIDVHHPYGGVVPELASRKHMEAIVPVFQQALAEAGITPGQIDAVSVTQGPGLIGSLLVGFSFAKAFAVARRLPWIGVSHLEGHLNSVFLSTDAPPFPFAALLVSGGHTGVYLVTGPVEYRLLGQTRDDAAGEAFDKVAKVLGLGYPGGAVLSRAAERGDPARVEFPRPFLDKFGFDFSFSGIKTAVNRYVADQAGRVAERLPDIAAGFQESVVEVLSHKILYAAESNACRHIALVGGVAANQRLREQVHKGARDRGIRMHVPDVALCGDNAAMIAAAGYHRLNRGERTGLDADVYSRTPAAA